MYKKVDAAGTGSEFVYCLVKKNEVGEMAIAQWWMFDF